MDYTTSDALFQVLCREFPSLTEHTIQSIINLCRNDTNLCYEACRKAVASKVLERSQAASPPSVSPGDASSRRSPMMMAASDFSFMHEQNGCPPEWRKAVLDPGYDIRATALANPHSIANGSPPTAYNHLQVSAAATAADYNSDRHRLTMSSHRRSEPDVFGSMQNTGFPPRPSVQRLSGGHPALSLHQESLIRRSPVNGLGQLKIVTDENAENSSWAQAMAADGMQQAFQSPVQQSPSLQSSSRGSSPPQFLRYASELATRQTPGVRNAISEDVLAQILVAQQRSHLEKLVQTTTTTESRLNQLLVEEARLADEIRDVKKRKQADGGGVLGNSTARELDKLKLENGRLRGEVLNLQKKADALAAVAPLIRIGSSVGGSLLQPPGAQSPPPPYGGLQRNFPVPATSSMPTTQGIVTHSPKPGVPISPPPVPPRSLPEGGQPPRVSPRTTQTPAPSLFGGSPLPAHVLPQSHQPLPPPARHDPRTGLVSRPPPAALALVQQQVPLDEGDNWSCSACTFLNHPTLSTCEICDTPRM